MNKMLAFWRVYSREFVPVVIPTISKQRTTQKYLSHYLSSYCKSCPLRIHRQSFTGTNCAAKYIPRTCFNWIWTSLHFSSYHMTANRIENILLANSIRITCGTTIIQHPYKLHRRWRKGNFFYVVLSCIKFESIVNRLTGCWRSSGS